MTRKRTVNDKSRRPLTRTARAARNSPMSEKRKADPPAAPKVTVKTKAASKVAAKAVKAKPAGTRDAGKKPAALRKTRVGRTRKARGTSPVSEARFSVGDVVRHRYHPFRGVIFDIDPVFANTDDWWLSIPEQMRPRKNQPFYHLLAENAETEYIAYVSEQNLLPDATGVPVRHPQILDYFIEDEDGRYRAVFMSMLN